MTDEEFRRRQELALMRFACPPCPLCPQRMIGEGHECSGLEVMQLFAKEDDE